MSAPSTATRTVTRPWPDALGTPPRGTLRRAVGLLEVSRSRFLLAVLLGTLALGCAVALAAVSAWLIARASQMPPVLTLSVATVGVRAFGIGRGVLRYVERLVSHDLALSGMTRLRTTLYERLADGRAGAVLGVRRGDLLARVGADVDDVGDLVVRGLLPASVAVTLGVATSTAMILIWPPAGLALVACLLLAGVVAPWLAGRSARATERRGAQARADVNAEALGLLDDAGPLTVAGHVPARLAALRDADLRARAAVDAGAGASAVAAGLGLLATGIAVLAALVTGVPAVGDGRLDPVLLAVVVLTPLAAFEATSVLPQAAVQVHRSRAAAARILALVDAAAEGPAATADGTAAVALPSDTAAGSRATAGPTPHDSPRADDDAPPTHLVAHGLVVGWPGGPTLVAGLDLDLRPGRMVAVVGPSGTGKTTLLLTLAGLLPPQGGSLTVDGGPVQPGASVALTAEDAHVFGTNVLENLRVARGDVTEDEAREALGAAGLGPWLSGLPDGLATLLGPDGRTLSGGERRRLLLARALVCPAPLLLLDEPTEHLDVAGADAALRALRGRADRGVLIVTHRLTGLDVVDEVVRLADGHVAARGTHTDLMERDADYREAVWHEHEETP
ncbi:thiol reductant ABC exporter subunit CydC [Cellulomonas persica]|uniref:Thiol reductant ABC exporter subunit CydC n=1 Tax=Cellulomonas persica TaxID=76861 RepID=A0A510UTJ7_9CELL|nr:thiol reductant ABC exporter subunit CydC [Cellulomonas persica]GEK17889.1 thiol reductant ABC exporter subunit CydC [Cellulomonas persica]